MVFDGCRKFRSNRKEFSRELKNVLNLPFLVISWLHLAMFLKSQPYDSVAIAFIGLKFDLE